MFHGLAMAAALSCSSPNMPIRAQVDIQDLLELRDISGLSVSPDGRQLVYQVQQADLASDAYLSAWCLLDIASGEVRTLGDGGDILMPILPGRERRTGMWTTLAPRWSPDQRQIAFLARRGRETQIELCAIERRGCRRVTQSAGDVEDFVWAADGQGIIFASRPPREDAQRALAEEGDQGFRLDERFDVFHSLAPIRLGIASPPIRYASIAGETERAATEAEISRFNTTRRAPLSAAMGAARNVSLFSNAPVERPQFLATRDVRDFVRWGEGAIWVQPAGAELAGSAPPLALWAVRSPSAASVRCAAAQCIGRIVEIAPAPDDRSVLFIRREGWAESRHALYLWDVDQQAVNLLWTGDEIVRVCAPRQHDAICFTEGPTRPRMIVVIDYATGVARTLVDPNPHLPASAFIPAQKHEWRTPLGDEVFGYVLRPAHGTGPVPLIVVQYRASGFLRGGVGDEYPVQAFARRGFAVLVLERPDPIELRARVRDANELDRQEWTNLAERRRTLAALTSGIDRLVELGIADRQRVGVTGLSDGAETTVFGLIHCGCIAAAAISSGVHDPTSLYFASDSERAAMRSGGRGDVGTHQDLVWNELSLSLNVGRVTAPILAQVADREAVFMLQAHRTFTDQGRPFELYVFPDEYHVKWRPRHRRAIYERSLDWFGFWLRGVESGDADDVDQYERWRSWRDARGR